MIFSRVAGIVVAAAIGIPTASLLYCGWRSAQPCDMDYNGAWVQPTRFIVCGK
jgi:hypothetical protein